MYMYLCAVFVGVLCVGAVSVWRVLCVLCVCECVVCICAVNCVCVLLSIQMAGCFC